MELSQLFSINSKEVLNGAINAVVAAIVVGLYGIVSKDGFDVFSIQWGPVIHMMINWAFAGFIGSVGKSFLTNSEGKVLGMQVKEIPAK